MISCSFPIAIAHVILTSTLIQIFVPDVYAREVGRQSMAAERMDAPVFKNGIIATTFGKQAADAGLAVLKSRGTAMDAALTMALSQVILSAGSWVSYAGILYIVYYHSDTKETYSLNAGFNTVLNEHGPLSIPEYDLLDDTKTTNIIAHGRVVLVPGFMAGLEVAHSRFGKLPFRDLFQPAITLAKNGILWTKELDAILKTRKNILLRNREARNLFFNSSGASLKVGDIFKQPAAAETLSKIAHHGAAYMYHGKWAEKFVSAVQKMGGKITMKGTVKLTFV